MRISDSTRYKVHSIFNTIYRYWIVLNSDTKDDLSFMAHEPNTTNKWGSVLEAMKQEEGMSIEYLYKCKRGSKDELKHYGTRVTLQQPNKDAEGIFLDLFFESDGYGNEEEKSFVVVMNKKMNKGILLDAYELAKESGLPIEPTKSIFEWLRKEV